MRDLHWVKVGLIAASQALGKSVRSVSDLSMVSPELGEMLGEDDRAPSDEELIDAAQRMIAALGEDRVALDAAQILIDFVDSKVGRMKPVRFNS
jgi:hypothetical protein